MTSYADGIAQVWKKQTVLVKLALDDSDYWLAYGDVPTDQDYYTCVKKIEWIPTRAAVDGGLGYFGEIVIRCQDFPYSQSGGAGSYFGRMLAGSNYYLNRLVDVYVGYYERGDTFNLSNFQKRTYFIKRIDGPNRDDKVTIYASDILSRMKESEIPAATEGNLNASITDSTTGTINITSNTGFSASGGYAAIEDEIVSYTGISSTDSITGVVRAQGGTKAESHDADAPVRVIYQSSGNVVDEIRTIIEDYTDIDHATYLPDTDWNTERDTNLAGDNVEIWVTEPTPVDEVIDSISKDNFVNVWWDDAAQEIKLKSIGPTQSDVAVWNDNENILDAKLQVKRDQKKVLTQVWYYFGKLDQSSGKSADNFEATYIAVRADVESDLGEERVKKVYAENVPGGGTGTADKVTSRLLDQFETPVEFICHVDAKDSTVEVGDAVTIETRYMQDSNGQPLSTIMRVIEKAMKDNNRYYYKLIKTGQETGDRYFKWGPDTLGSYASEDDADKAVYGWWADDDPDVDGDDPYLWQ